LTEATLSPPAPKVSGEIAELERRIADLQARVSAGEQRRRAMLHIMSDLGDSNRRLNNQRRAMLHILADYERDRQDLARQSEGLNNSRRALMHILQDAQIQHAPRTIAQGHDSHHGRPPSDD